MHPSELKNRALTAAVSAEREGFTSTAEAFRHLALLFSKDAILLQKAMGDHPRHRDAGATKGHLDF